MVWSVLIPAAASLIGGAVAGRSAEKAANVQANAAGENAQLQLQAAREANELQRQMFLQGVLMQSPNLQAGQIAQSALLAGLGLPGVTPRTAGSTTAPSFSGNVAPAGQQTGAGGQPLLTDAEGRLVTPTGEVVDAGAGNPNFTNINVGNIGATEEQLAAARSSMPSGYFTEEFSNDAFYRDPSYQFRLDEGMRALRAQQAASGNRFSGQSLKDITNYAQGAASQEYGSAYERFMRNRQAVYDRISNLAGLSPNTASSVASAGSTAASNIGSNIVGGASRAGESLLSGAAATAGGVVGSTNAMIGGVNNALNNYWMMNALRGAGGTMPTPRVGTINDPYWGG